METISSLERATTRATPIPQVCSGAAEKRKAESGIMSSADQPPGMAAATSYSTNNLIMVPFYIYYSMFGYQRVGDFVWAAGDMHGDLF